MTSNDFSDPNVITSLNKKEYEEVVTNHNITLLILMRVYYKYREKIHNDGSIEEGLTPTCRLGMGLLFEYFLRSFDLTYTEFVIKLRSPEYDISPNIINEFRNKVKEIVSDGVDMLMVYITDAKLCVGEHSFRISPILVGRYSSVGTFLRRMVITVNKLTMAQAVKVHRLFQRYYRKGILELYPYVDNSVMECEGKIKKSLNSLFTLFDYSEIAEMDDTEIISWSRKQTELFLANQTTLLSFDENSAYPAVKLHDQLNEIVRINPNYAEAYYVQYLNCLRTREYNGAQEYLRKYFDLVATSVKSEDKSKCFRYSALNLAILHANFNNKEASLNSLKEAIMLSHSSNDLNCLYTAYTWYRYLNPDKEIEHVNTLIPKFEALQMSPANSISLQTYAREFVFNGQSSNSSFQLLTRSDVINSKQMLHDFILLSFSNKAAIWDSYGKQSMAFALSQIALNINLPNIFNELKEYNTESICISICNCALYLLQEGSYRLARLVLSCGKDRFPNRYSEWWKLCDQVIYFEYALSLELWNDADNIATQIAAIDTEESILRHAQLCLEKGDREEAFNLAKKLISKDDVNPVKKLRAYLIIICSVQTSALTWILKALDMANHFKFIYLKAIVKLELSKLQFQMGFINETISLLDQCKISVFSENRIFYQADYCTLFAKCKVASVRNCRDEVQKRCKIKEALNTLEQAKILYQRLQRNSKVKDTVYLQALFANEAGLEKLRNMYSLKFRQLNEQNPSSNSISCSSILY